MAHDSLFKPITINSVEVKNRVVMAPMAMNYSHPPGYVNEQGKAFFAARAKGGVGLVILGGSFSTKWAWDTTAYPYCYGFDSPEPFASIVELVERVHAFGAKIFVQLMPCLGRQGTSQKKGITPVSCTAEPFVITEENLPEGLNVPGGWTGETPRELSVSEIVEIEDAGVDAVIRSVDAGFDGIEIPCHHGYLMMCFLSPLKNRRNDLYGGSLQNRMRFLLNTVRKTKDKIGPDFVLGVRLCCNEHLEGGLSVAESVEVAKTLEKEGVDYISLADGCYETCKYMFSGTDGSLVEHGEPQEFKKALKIPVITPNLHSPELAERAVSTDVTDMIALGRPLLADPEWVNKVQSGKADEITVCDRDNFCLLKFFFGYPVRCKLNPNLGREQYMREYWQPPYEY